MQDLKDTRTLTLDGGLRCSRPPSPRPSEIGQPMCIAVVDAGGNLLAFARMDGSKALSA